MLLVDKNEKFIFKNELAEATEELARRSIDVEKEVQDEAEGEGEEESRLLKKVSRATKSIDYRASKGK